MKTYSLYLSTTTPAGNKYAPSGRISATAWSGATAYVAGDIVNYNGILYVSKLAGTNQLPTAAASTFWNLGGNLGTITWNINWKEIFGDFAGDVNVRCKLVSTSTSFTADTTALYSSSLRGSFICPYSNNQNGVNLASIFPIIDPLSSSKLYLLADSTTNAAGVTIKAPTSNQNLTIQLISPTEITLPIALDYQLWLYFDDYHAN